MPLYAYPLIAAAVFGLLTAFRNVIGNLADASDPDEQARAEFRWWFRGELRAFLLSLALIGLGYILGKWR